MGCASVVGNLVVLLLVKVVLLLLPRGGASGNAGVCALSGDGSGAGAGTGAGYLLNNHDDSSADIITPSGSLYS